MLDENKSIEDIFFNEQYEEKKYTPQTINDSPVSYNIPDETWEDPGYSNPI